jgi:glucose/arabinose dehydrogenase
MENFKKRGITLKCLSALMALVVFSTVVKSQPSINLIPVISEGLVSPIQILHAGDGSNRIFIVERAGVVKAFGGALVDGSYPFLGTYLDITDKVGTVGEGGLLSIAFHPDYEVEGANYGVFFAFYTDRTAPYSDLVVEKYKITAPAANTAIVASSEVILRIPHPNYSNHNGGEMHFGNDGFLYLSVGDGGGAGDPNNNAQRTLPASAGDKSYLLGKMLRIDVNNSASGNLYAIPPGNPFGNEVFDYGLRNPFRWSFDRVSGDMWIGDVGQSSAEEVNYRAAATAPGVNYGWNCFEGTGAYTSPGPGCGGVTNYTPAFSYSGQSVIGGIYYRGTNTALAGYYIGADFYSGNIHLITRNPGNTAWVTTVRSGYATGISDMGESQNGEVHAVSLTGNTVYLVSSTPLPVKLVSLEGRKTVEGVQLSWETSAEMGFAKFDVEHSTDRAGFVTVGTVDAKNAVTGAQYMFSHANYSNDHSYYRLKMVDIDGTSEYSKMIVVQGKELSAPAFVRPSVVNSGTMNLLLEGNYQSLELTGVNGALVHRQNISGKRGAVDIPVSTITTGMYIVRLINDEEVKQQKIVIMN